MSKKTKNYEHRAVHAQALMNLLYCKIEEHNQKEYKLKIKKAVPEKTPGLL